MTDNNITNANIITCPLCGWKIYFEAARCPHCGGAIDGNGAVQVEGAAVLVENAETGTSALVENAETGASAKVESAESNIVDGVDEAENRKSGEEVIVVTETEQPKETIEETETKRRVKSNTRRERVVSKTEKAPETWRTTDAPAAGGEYVTAERDTVESGERYSGVWKIVYDILRRLGVVGKVYGLTEKEMEWYKAVDARINRAETLGDFSEDVLSKYMKMKATVAVAQKKYIREKYSVDDMTDEQLMLKYVETAMEEPGHTIIMPNQIGDIRNTDGDMLMCCILERLRFSLKKTNRLRIDALIKYTENKYRCSLESVRKDAFLDILSFYKNKRKTNELEELLYQTLIDKYQQIYTLKKQQVIDEICAYESFKK